MWEADMTNRTPEFLSEEAIELATHEAARIFRVSPEEVLVAVEKQEVEIMNPFRGAREKKEAQIIAFAVKGMSSPEKVALPRLVVADASRMFPSDYHCMPLAYQIVARAGTLESLDKLHRIIVDGWLIVLEFRAPLSCRELVQAINAFASGFMTNDGGIAVGDDQTWVAIRYGFYK
jgi:hypothetical protein